MRRLLGVLALVVASPALAAAQRVQIDNLPAHVIVDSCNGCGGGVSGTIGAAVPATASPIAVKDNAGNLAYPLVDASGNLLVAVTGAGSGGTSSVDGAAYVAGTTAGTPAIVARDDASVGQLAEDKVGITRGTAFRAMHVNFRNASGTEIGIAGNAIIVDGSAVTQPVSGTVTVTDGAGAINVVCDSGCGGAASFEDDEPFTGGTTPIANMGAVFNDGLAAVTSGNAAAPRITAQRGVHVNLRTAAGAELLLPAALAANGGLKIEGVASGVAVPVSGTFWQATQPVSGTFWQATQPVSGTFWQATQAVSGTFWQATQPVSGTFWQATQPVSGTVTVTDGAGAVNVICDSGCAAGTPGQAVMADSSPVVIASDQSAVPVSGTVTANIGTVATLATAANQTTEIGHVDGLEALVTTLTTATAVLGTATYTEATTVATTIGAVRRDADTTLVNTTNELGPLQMDANGRLKVEAFSGEALPVTGTFWQATQPVSGTVTVTDGAGALNTIIDSGTVTVTDGAGALNVIADSGTITTVSTVTAVTAITNALPAGTNLLGQVSPVATATTTNTAATCYITSAASTNATSCKASAGNLYGYDLINTTATLYYLRLYNLAAAPTCSSATGFIRTLPIPASATGAGLVRDISVGEAYATGIAFCLTGGGSSTDNTNAATGVYITLHYK